MKLTTVILLAAFLHASASTFAQNVTIQQKKATLAQIFSAIHEQTGYNVLWSGSEIKGLSEQDVNFKNLPFREVLDNVLKDQPLIYEIQDKTVFIKPKAPEAEKQKTQINAQPVTVTGKVTNELGEPMAGVTVRQKDNPSNGTVTDAKGNYSLNVPDNNTFITFTFVGYEAQELRAKDVPQGSSIIMKPASQNLQEVVINKGYYREKQELSTGDVSIVDSKTLEQQPVFDPIQALEGRVSGLDIQQNSGIPGAYATVRIRGVNSIASGTVPLYIIDGVPFESQSLSSNYNNNALGFGNPGTPTQQGTTSNYGGISPFSALNMDDIESIEILKDADATAIYGSRGSNGVVIITTKRGKTGATKVNIDLSQGIGQVGHFMDLLNTQQYLQMRREAFANDGIPVPSITNDPSDYNYDIDGLWDTTRNTNWQKVLIGGTAHYSNAQASVSGGTANTQFLVSGGYSRQTTVFPGDYNDQKGSLHFNITTTSDNQKFRMQVTGSYMNDNNLLPLNDFTNYINLPPDAPAIYNPNGSINWQLYQGSQTFNNPLAQTVETSSSVTNNLVGNLELSYELLPGLSLKSDFGFNHDEMTTNYLSPASANAPPYNLAPYNGSAFSNSIFQTWTIEPALSYQKKIAKGDLNALIGGTWQQNQQQNNTMFTSDYATDALLNDPAAANPAYTSLNYTYTQYRYTSVYGRIGYNWEEKYLLNITARRDGSSSFGPGREFGNFGAIGAGWIFSKEKFVEDFGPWLSFGKLRGSYGVTGNDQFNYYQYLSTYNVNNTTYQGNIGLLPTALTNPYLEWEVNKKLEGGLDLGFLQDRINFSVDYYRNRSGNQLVRYPLPHTTGFSSIAYNLPALVQNTGVELNLTTTNIKAKDFGWTTAVNFSIPNNKLIAYPGLAQSSYSNIYVVGQSLFIRKLYQYTGVNSQTGEYTVATANASGNPSYPQDLVSSAPVTQKYFGGIQNSFNYKNFSLDIFIQYVNQLNYSYVYSFSMPGPYGYNQPTAVLNAWSYPGDKTNVQAFSTSNNTSFGNFYQSTGILTNGSFLRLKNAALSYRLPATWQKWANMHNARIYIQGQNLYTFTHYVGLDPETPGLGLPPLRVITAGVSATF